MNRFYYLAFILLTACFEVPDLAVVQGSHPKKQKYKINQLQKKLEVAEKEEKKAKEEVEKLSSEIFEAKLALIRKQIDFYEKKKTKGTSLFLEERETLYQMIQLGPLSSALQAQFELDRILHLITADSDECSNL